jgi:hypothetical protein
MVDMNTRGTTANNEKAILIGSAFPLTLIRRRVVITPCSLETVRDELRARPFVSFWGHDNTLVAAHSLLGIDLKPREERPAVTLNTEQFPTLYGQVFTECLILSPNYIPGFRPKIGEEVGKEKITGWQALRIVWEH